MASLLPSQRRLRVRRAEIRGLRSRSLAHSDGSGQCDGRTAEVRGSRRASQSQARNLQRTLSLEADAPPAAIEIRSRNPKSSCRPTPQYRSVRPPTSLPAGRLFEPPPAPFPRRCSALLKKKKKKKKKVIGEHAFKDYYDYTEPLGKVPPHRVLAINRGERAHAIRVKIEADIDAMLREAEQFCSRPNHPHAEFLRACVRDCAARG